MKVIISIFIVMFFVPAYGQIKLKNNVELNFNYDYMKHMDKINAERTLADKGNIEKT